LEEEIESSRRRTQELNNQIVDLAARLASVESTAKSRSTRVEQLEIERGGLLARHDELVGDQKSLTAEVARLTTALKAEREQTADKIALLEQAKDHFSSVFKALADDILEEKSSKFTEEASRDGGVDAIVFDPDPIRGGKIVIQAKRYTNTVSVSAVRDLFGTIHNEGLIKEV
jgi:restriction endonuclease Mrr